MKKTFIDLSYANGVVNFNLLKTNVPQLSGAYLKLDEGVGDKYIDTRIKQNIEGCQKIGLPFGLYHFATLNDAADIAGDAKRESDSFSGHCHYVGVTPSIIPAIDVETNVAKLKPAQVVLWLNTFFSELKNNGITDFRIYGSPEGPGGLNTILPKDHSFGNIKLWVAGYPNNWTPQSNPLLPHGWPKYDLWQYTSKGHAAGVNGNVDLSVSFD